MMNSLRILGLTFALFTTGISLGQTFTVNHDVDFETNNQNMWGPSFSPITLDQTINLFHVPWDVSFNTGSGGIFTIAGFDFGGALSGGFSGYIGSEIRIEGFTTGTVDVDYPITVSLEMPNHLSYDQGDTVLIETSYTVDSDAELLTSYPSAGEFFWDLYFRMAANASATLCFFGCTTFPIIPAFDTGHQQINMVTISGSGASTSGETGIWFIGPVEYFSPPSGYPVPPNSLFPIAYDPDFSSPNPLPGVAHIGAFPAELPDTDFGLTGSITIPYVETTDYINGTQLDACGDSTWFNMNLEIFKFIGFFLSQVPEPNTAAVGEALGYLSGSENIGIAEITWNFFSASFDANITNKQCFNFNPTVYGQFVFPVAVDYQVLNGASVINSGQSSVINVELGQDIRYKFPCYFDSLSIQPTYTIDGRFRNHTWDSVSFDFLMSAFEFGFTVPSVTVIPGFTIPSVCFPVPYPCPTWSNPFRWCTTTVCTPEIVVPPIGFGGWSLSIGPLWETSIPLGGFEYDWFDETWSLEGFTPQSSPAYAFPMRAAKISASNSQTNVSCKDGTNGAIDVTITQVTPATPFTYTWTNGASTQDLTGLTAGPYQVSVYDVNGCQMFTGATITEPQKLEVEYVKTDKSCGGGPNNGSIDVSVLGGTGPYTYLWGGGQTSQDLTGLAAGTYTLTVTDANLCTGNISVTINEPAVLGQNGIVADVKCLGGSDGSIQVTTFGGTLPYVYAWSSLQNTEDIINVPAGPYTLTITDGNGCTSIGNYNVGQPATYVSLSSVVSPVLCRGGNSGAIDVTVADGTPGYTYVWSSLTGGILPFTTQDISNLQAGEYTVTVKDANGCQNSLTQTVTQPAQQLASSPSIVHVLCNGDATGSINPGVSGGTAPYTYAWSNGANTPTLNGVVAGTYGLNLTDNNGCTAAWSYQINQPANPVSVVLSGVNILCFGDATGSASASVSGGTASYTYLWSTGSSSPSISGLPAGTYDVTVTDANGCSENQSITLTQPAAPLAISSTLTAVDCYGNNSGSIDITVTGGTSPYDYQWSNGGTIIMSDTTQDVSNQYADTYLVEVTDANGCEIEMTNTITQPAAPISMTAIIDHVNCFGISDGGIDATVQGGTAPYVYSWSNGANTEDISNVSAGTYTLTVTDLNLCVLAQSYTVQEPIAALTVSAFPKEVICNGESTGGIDAVVSGGTAPYTYAWSNGATTQDLALIPAGAYSLTVTDAQGCTAFTGTMVNEPAALVVTTTITDASCYDYRDGQIVLNVSGGIQPYYFNWGNENEIMLNNPSETLSNLPAALYYIRVRDENGCEVELTATVNEPALFEVETTVVDASCYGSNDGFIDAQLSGGTTPYSYNWSDGQITEDAFNLIEGTYTYTMTDAMGCIVLDSTYVGQPDSIDVNYEIIPVSCVDQSDAAIYLSTFGGTPPYTYVWNDGSTEQNLEGLTAGDYFVTITDDQNCTNIFNFIVMVNDQECLIIPNTFTPNGDNYNDTWVLGNLDLYPNCMVKIFNKWGNEIYSTSGEYIPWDGTHNGNPLPSEVYYYIIKLNNNDDNQYTGNVTIVR